MMPASAGPRVPFLERLEPGSAKVRAALPSRFAVEPSAWVGTHVEAVAPRRDAGSTHVSIAQGTPMPREVPPAAQSLPAAAMATQSSDEREVGADPAVVALSVAPPPVHEPADPPVPPHAQLPSEADASAKLESPVWEVMRAPQSQVAMMPSSVALRAPLRDASLPLRVQPVAEAPLAVHVSIDRIEVRAPATTPRNGPVQAKSRPATVPLAGYLRQRKSGST